MLNYNLIVYYSWQGNTERVAKAIQHQVGGDIFRLEPVKPYTTNYSAAVAQARREIREGYLPELKSIPDTSEYAAVFLGSPIWCGTMASPLATFISSSDFAGKLVLPFYTHGGGGGGRYERVIAQMCSGAELYRAFSTYNNGDSQTVAQIALWLKDAGLV